MKTRRLYVATLCSFLSVAPLFAAFDGGGSDFFYSSGRLNDTEQLGFAVSANDNGATESWNKFR
ncbi:MAG: hypothetical protein AAF335_00740 [Bacteroidota bacterium]